MTGDEIDLKHLQEMLYRLLVAPTGVAEGLARETTLPTGGLAGLIASDDRMTPVERVEIYANGYFYRILDVLKEDFPATLGVVGADIFHNLVTSYLIEFPPTEPSITGVGENLPPFLRAHPMRERWPFIADLAQLERSTLESFHAADAAALEVEAVRAIAPEEWPALKMRTHPATRLVDSAWRVDQVLRAVEDGGSRPTPETATRTIENNAAETMPAREDVTIVVWRRDARVFYRALETVEREALRLASVYGGATFAEICEAIAATQSGVENVAALINRLFARWLQDSLLVSSTK